MKTYWSEKSVVGKLCILIGVLILVPLTVLLWYWEEREYLDSFLIPGGSSIILGILLCVFSKKESELVTNYRFQIGYSSLIVVFAWIWGVFIGALPFILGGQLRVIQALFEAVSGWTTTGLSVMDVSNVPMIYLFHRSFMQYCGGLGFILMMIIFISNKYAVDLYSAEGHPDKIKPNIKRTVHAIFILYNICLLVGTIAYHIAGMTWFDSICHCMCSLSTGGFSTKLLSIGEYSSLSIEIITIILMLVGTTNFAALLLLAKGELKTFFHISEVRFMIILLLVFIPPTAISLTYGLNIEIIEGIRRATFDIVSALSTTGYSTMSYTDWPDFSIGVLILMMIIGGGIGSTAGGIKLSRVYLACRYGVDQIKKKMSPNNQIVVSYYTKANGKTSIDQATIEDTTGYIIIYLIIYVIGSLALTITANCSLIEAMFDFASSLSTVGLSIGITNTLTNDATLIIEMVGMLLGRLEIFIVIVGGTFGYRLLRQIVAGRKI
ncbi:MAG: TrkH family potassium uptake protein [Erysipelotrichaceae bacterium]|nr:TrkH family potassium uptake protein [Erysipelotrichaceae bacterium]